ncbi:MAG: hypothetical protein AB7U75_20250 [Hyphomicrobiaceae bacterium]
MLTKAGGIHSSVSAGVALCCCLAFVAALPGAALSAEGVVPITSEPVHKIRFDNGKVRVIEAAIAKGKASLFHTHLHDAFFVFFNAAEVGNQMFGEMPVFVKLQAGAAHFTSTANGSYVHSVIATDESAVHVSALELMRQPTSEAATAPEERFPPFEVVVDNPRGRLYRLKLNAGQSTEAFARSAGTAVFAISSGRISEKSEGKPDRLWDFDPGHFRWIEAGEELMIRNEGTAPVHLVEIEVF